MGDLHERFNDIAESQHRLLNPLTDDQLMLLGDICRPTSGTRCLDLACGRGEMLCRWAAAYGILGVGVDTNADYLEAARLRAHDLRVSDQLLFVHEDANTYPEAHHSYDLVCCLGASWLAGGLLPALDLMRPALKDDHSLLLIGEPYWTEPPPPAAVDALVGGDARALATLADILDAFESAGLELVDVVIAERAGWDRYEARQWRVMLDWLRRHPTDPDHAALLDWLHHSRRSYLLHARRYLEWAVFVLQPA